MTMTTMNECEVCGQAFGDETGGIPIERDKRNPDRCTYCANPLDERAMMAMYEWFKNNTMTREQMVWQTR